MPIEEKIFRTAIYCRLSKEDGDKAVSNSIEGQVAYCMDFVNRQSDLKLDYPPFCDDGFSGLSLNRPAFQDMDLLMRNGKIDCIVCKDLSRFTRDFAGGGEYLESILPRYGVRFIAINNCDTQKDDGEQVAFIMPLLNLFNENYSRDTSVKIRSSLNVKRKNGDNVSPSYPYGYKKSEKNRYRLVPDEEASQNVQLIFTLYKDGLNIPKIAKELNQRGILVPLMYKRSQGTKSQGIFQTREKPQWEYNMVRRILTNEVYIGTLIQKKTSSKNCKVKKQVPVPSCEQIAVENAHEPLVSHEDFFAVQELLKRNVRHSPTEGANNLLSGFIFCADCGGTMIKKTLTTNGRKYDYYVCSHNKNTKECSSHSINQRETEEAVLAAIHVQIELVSDMEEVIRELEQTPSDKRANFSYEQQISKIEEDIASLKKFKLRLYNDLKDEIINKEEYNEYRKEYDENIADKEKQKEKLVRTKEESNLTGIGTNNWVKLFREFEAVEQLERRVLMGLVDKIYVHEGHEIEIVFKYEDEFAETKEYISFRSQENKIITM